MTFVEFSYGGTRYFVSPQHVAYLRDHTKFTTIHFAGGEKLDVDGDANAVGMKLQGRR